MKRIATIFCLALLFVNTASATMPKGQNQEEQKYFINIGNLHMMISENGGKILSLKYDETEVISQLRWPESFGSTFWTSPQREWNWPPVSEFDKQPYTVEQNDDAIVMTSQPSSRLGLQVSKKFTTDKQRKAIVITYTIKNVTDTIRSVAPWEITRVPNSGLIFFDASKESISPANLLPFQFAHNAAWYLADATNENRKINADGKGWLAYANNGLLLVKQFTDLDASQPAPGEAEVQVYVNRGTTYIELESQGAYTTLNPGQQLSWTVCWYLLPCNAENQPSQSLLDLVRRVLSKENISSILP
ncbi:MAG: hypothetical protein IKI83_08740 [Prevotella sp.]|nr:hypothetical protein [Prevotella sp.]